MRGEQGAINQHLPVRSPGGGGTAIGVACRHHEENLKELKDFKATKMREEKRQRKAEKKKFRKEKKRLLKAVSKNIHQLEASESVVDNLFESNTVDNSLEDDEQVDCTICAETIKDYVPKYFSGIPLNPACERCNGEVSDDVQCDENANIKNDQDTKIPHLETSLNPDSFQLSLTSANSLTLAKDDLEPEFEKEKVKPEQKIRQKINKKLEMRFNNGEISKEEMLELEEELVKELKAELLGEYETV